MKWRRQHGEEGAFRMGRPLRTVADRPLISLCAVLAAAATVGGLLQVQVDTSTKSLVPAGDPSYGALEARARSFGDDPVVLLMQSPEPRGLIANTDNLMRLVGLEGRLAGLPDVAAVYGPATVLNQVAGAAQDLLAQISGARDAARNTAVAQAAARGRSAAQSKAAGDAAVAAFDRRYGTLVSLGLPAGLPTLKNTQFVQTVLFGEDGEPKPAWQFVIPREDTVAVLIRPREDMDQDANARLVGRVRSAVKTSGLDLERVTVTGVPVVTAELSEQARQELPRLGGLAALAVGLVFLLAPWNSRRRARLRPLGIALSATAITVAAFGWSGRSMSIGVVAFMPILLGIASNLPFYVGSLGRQRRVAVVAVASACGYGSLLLSPLPFVRELGLALAVGMIVTAVLAFVVGGPGLHSPSTTPSDRVQPTGLFSPFRGAVVIAGIAVAIAGWVALPNLQVDTRPDELAKGLSVMDDVHHAEDVLGSSGEVSLVLTGKDVLSPAPLRWAVVAEKSLVNAHGDQLKPIITIPGLFRFLGKNPTSEQINAGLTLMPSYLTSSVVRQDRTMSTMVFGVRFESIDEQRALLDDARDALPSPPAGYKAEFVGLPVVAVQGFDLVTARRLLINVVGIAAAVVVLLAGLRRRRDAWMAALSVVLATGWVLAASKLFGGAASPLTLAIGSFTTATACEFAVMRSAISFTRKSPWQGVRTPAIAAVLGYLALTASGVALLREFGIMLAVSVVSSYVAAALVVWALAPRTHEPDHAAHETPRQHIGAGGKS